jgi:hypothetical protein
VCEPGIDRGTARLMLMLMSTQPAAVSWPIDVQTRIVSANMAPNSFNITILFRITFDFGYY